MRHVRGFTSALLCYLVLRPAFAESATPDGDFAAGRLPVTLAARYISSNDGDTFRALTSAGEIRVRIAGADTPETGQAFWRAARSQLRTIVENAPLTLFCYKRDRDRLVCNVTADHQDVGLGLVTTGYAWHAAKYSHEQSPPMARAYAMAEEVARQHRLGLWQSADPMAPWQCRKLRRDGLKCR